MSERTVHPFILRDVNRDCLIGMTIKATVNSTKVFANSKQEFFSEKSRK
jgi:hypothetical protein